MEISPPLFFTYYATCNDGVLMGLPSSYTVYSVLIIVE